MINGPKRATSNRLYLVRVMLVVNIHLCIWVEETNFDDFCEQLKNYYGGSQMASCIVCCRVLCATMTFLWAPHECGSRSFPSSHSHSPSSSMPLHTLSLSLSLSLSNSSIRLCLRNSCACARLCFSFFVCFADSPLWNAEMLYTHKSFGFCVSELSYF